MVTLRPVRRALVPIDSAAAAAISAPNYDEFQGDHEIRALIAESSDSVLQVTMAHCSDRADGPIAEASPASLALAGENMKALVHSPLTRVAEDVVWIYELADPRRKGAPRQIGLGGMARVDEIRTADNPKGTIIRNEGIYEKKARGRADLIVATDAIIGTVNNAVDDADGTLAKAMLTHADGRKPDFEMTDHDGVAHRVWLVQGEAAEALCAALGQEPHAYVADGNHRSAAAALLGFEGFISVFFPVHRMGLAPYNRLVKVDGFDLDGLLKQLDGAFEVAPRDDAAPFQPREVHTIGLYADGRWWTLTPRKGTYDPQNAVQDIDSDIIQRNFFSAILGIDDAADPRLTFVGGNKDARWLMQQVDGGAHDFALTVAPVTVDQFVQVCLQNRIMPPKSTWFQPKLRSGMVMALLG